ncbi:hypothetical protein EDO6_01871 [Paenibacillus xylanexedens]|nr:hypothetical protein EDO6_01871 [Paenibacillus xylanexedens]
MTLIYLKMIGRYWVRSLRRLEPMEQYIFNTAHMKKIYGDVFVERFFSSLDCNMA